MIRPWTLLASVVCWYSAALSAQSPAPTLAARAPEHAQLLQSAQRLLERAAAELPGVARVRVAPLDPRLRLAPCPTPAEPFLPPGSRLLGSVTVGVRCPSAGWTVYTAARVDVALPVVVASKPLGRGATPGVDDIRLQERELASLPAGYLSDPAALAGQRLRRGVRAGSVITPAMLEATPLVRRGETVTLVYGAAGFEVRGEGVALADAAAGDHLRVRSSSSERIVHGEVSAARTVRVLR